jgi:hypothetical protein
VTFVPERRFGFAVITNQGSVGWRVRTAVDAALLKVYEGLELKPNQAHIGYRGQTETLRHVTPLATQPPAAEYVGLYRESRTTVNEVRAAPSGGLLVGSVEVRFFGPDLAVSVSGGNPGISYNFVRDGGRVQWMRSNGQISKKDFLHCDQCGRT